MKALYTLGIIAALIFSACSTTYHTHVYPDDVYYSSNDNEAVTEDIIMDQPVQDPDPDYTTSEIYEDEDGDTYITNNYYQGDNYKYYDDDDYDYYYASRIRRFHRPYYGFSYWSGCYTDYYWYTYNPAYYGVSIYFGWGRPWYSRPYYWCRPHYYTSYWHHPYYSYYYPFYHSYNYYYSYNPYHWGHYPYYGHYGYGYPYGSYYSSYYNGYYGHGSHNDYGYGSYYDPADYYYGHRGSMASNTGITGDRSAVEFGKTNNTQTSGTSTYVGRKDSREIEKGVNVSDHGDGRDDVVKNNNENNVTPDKSARTLIDKNADEKDIRSATNNDVKSGENKNTFYGRTPVEKPSKGTDIRTSHRPYQPTKFEEKKGASTHSSGTHTSGYTKPVRNYSTPDRSSREFERKVIKPKSQSNEYNYPGRNNTPDYKSRDNNKGATTKPKNSYEYKYKTPDRKSDDRYNRTEPNNNRNDNNYSQPSKRSEPSRKYESPSRKSESPKSYSTPSRQSQPSKSYSSPKRESKPSKSYSSSSRNSGSNKSYSSPGRSNSSSKSSGSKSYSGGSNSSSSSGSKSSGSSRSGGSRRK